MLKLKELLNEQDNTTSAKEFRKIEKTITRGMDMVFDKGVKYLRDYDTYKILPFSKKLMKVDPKRPEHNFFNYSNIVFIRKNKFK